MGRGPLPPNIHWATGSGTWDTSTYNWKGAVGSTNYVDGVPVEFKDADATGNPTVTLGITVQPASVAASASSQDYILTGSGAINGSAGLSKSGTSALTLDLANDYTGGTTLSAGTLNLKQASALGDVSGTVTIFGGTLDNTKGSALTTLDYPQAWNGDFTFAGSSDLNLGAGGVTLGFLSHRHGQRRHPHRRRQYRRHGLWLDQSRQRDAGAECRAEYQLGRHLDGQRRHVAIGLWQPAHHFNGDTRLVGGTLLLADPSALPTAPLTWPPVTPAA